LFIEVISLGDYVSTVSVGEKNYEGMTGIQLALGGIQWWVWLVG